MLGRCWELRDASKKKLDVEEGPPLRGALSIVNLGVSNRLQNQFSVTLSFWYRVTSTFI